MTRSTPDLWRIGVAFGRLRAGRASALVDQRSRKVGMAAQVYAVSQEGAPPVAGMLVVKDVDTTGISRF